MSEQDEFWRLLKEQTGESAEAEHADAEHADERPDGDGGRHVELAGTGEHPDWDQPAQRTGPRQFRNPYSFIPAPPRDIWSDSALKDRPPHGHHRYEDAALSGRLTVTMTVVTPLLAVGHPLDVTIPDADRGHEAFDVRVRGDLPDIAPTGVRGMLRASFEAVTNSRMAIFGHSRLLTRRMAFDEANVAIPVRAWTDKKGNFEIERMERLRLPFYAPRARVCYGDTGLVPQHGHVVTVRCEKGDAGPIVVGIERVGPGTAGSGWVVITGAGTKKEHESVFMPTGAPVKHAGLEQLSERWQAIVGSYVEASKQPGAIGMEGVRHVDLAHADLRALLAKPYGVLAWATFGRGTTTVEFVCPTLVSRIPYPNAPLDALPRTIRPATSRDELSPADRVFGWVAGGGQSTDNAHRGQLRVRHVRCTGKPASGRAVRDLPGDGIPLAILSSPKPQQALFYAAGDRQGHAMPDGQIKEVRRWALNGDLVPRGRKVYPNQRLKAENFAGSDPRGEFRRLNDDRDKQNRTIKQWIEPGTVFEFDLDVVNLDRAEAGALVWLLSEPGRHRLGGGRPLGFGAVRLQLDNVRLRTGKQMKTAFRELSADTAPSQAKPLEPDELACLKDHFLTAARKLSGCSSDEEPEFIVAFQRAMTGYEDDLPTHYPRLTREGPNYEWFVNNATTTKKSEGGQFALGDIESDPGLPDDPSDSR